MCLLLAVAATRLVQLASLPPGLWYDEAYYALDAAWVAETHPLQVFFPANNGREPLMPYLGALSMSVLGQTPYALRLVAALAAVLTVALLHRWLTTMFAAEGPDRRWLALIAAGGLTFSSWHLVMSRTGHRAALFPACLVLVAWLFWRAWRRSQAAGVRHSGPAWLLAGLALGASQYSYLSARLLPLVLVLFGLLVSRLAREPDSIPLQSGRRTARGHGRRTWAGLLAAYAGMGIAAVAAFAPLGLYFLQHPGAFAARSGDVFILDQIARGTTSWPQQLLDAVRVFVDGADPHWRHNLADQPGFGLLEQAGFWIGLLVSLRRIRKPPYAFLLAALVALWLPALLSVPAVYTLRVSGLLPVYYAIMAVGWVAVARKLGRLIPAYADVIPAKADVIPAKAGTGAGRRFPPQWTRPAVALPVIIAGAILVTPAYFVRWAQTPMVYSQYNGPLADLAHWAAQETDATDVLLPLPVYLHPTVHFLLGSRFPETATPPSPSSGRPAVVVEVPDAFLIPNVVAINRQSSWMWLSRDRAGQGTAYLLHLAQPEDIAILEPAGEAHELVVGPTHDRVATLIPCRSLAPLLASAAAAETPAAVRYDWGHQVLLTGYQVGPALVPPGGATTLNLYWRGLTDQPDEYRTFVHVLDAAGQPVSQADGITLSEEQRWRRGRLSPEQHTLVLPADAAPGAYLVRVGLLTPGGTGRPAGERAGDRPAQAAPSGMARLPVYSVGGQMLGDQLEVGLFYVTDARGQHDPRVPEAARPARLGNAIELLGFSLPPCAGAAERPGICVRLHWQSIAPAERNYTAFVQLLDAGGGYVTGYDAQPLNGLYPTSRWQPGEVIVSDFRLALPASHAGGRHPRFRGDGPAAGYRLVTGLYDLTTGERLPVTTVDGVATGDVVTLVSDLQLPE